MDNKKIELAARIVSSIFNPFFIPFGAFLVLFLFSYLRMMPLQYKIIVLGVVCCFTILMPVVTIFIFQKINGWGVKELGHREKRFVPYMLAIVAYIFCLLMMYKLHIPRYMSGIIMSALIAMLLCIIINLKWKISEHMAGMGGIVGGLVAFGLLFNYNPVWWLCFFILAAGCLGTARIVARQHTLAEVLTGFVTGFGCAIFGILFI